MVLDNRDTGLKLTGINHRAGDYYTTQLVERPTP